MNETTILVWINIAIVGIIAIIIVKLYFRKDELEKDDSPLLSKDSLNKLSQSSENNLSKTAPNNSFVSTYFSKQDQPKGTSLRKQGQIPEDNFNSYIVPETNEHLFSDKSENEEDPAKPINFNYETKVQKFQEPINETQMDIMSKNNKNTKKEINENNISLEEKPKHELKDLFSIDELIKESKRKLSARELEFMDNISIDWIPKNIDTESNGSHNGENYIAYTFYIENEGEETINYWYSIIIDDVIKNVDEAARVMVYLNGDRRVYAKVNSYTNEPEKDTLPFYSKDEAVLEQRKDFKPGDIDKFTIVIWLEGDDPDCVDNILGGEIKMHMEIREEHKEESKNNEKE